MLHTTASAGREVLSSRSRAAAHHPAHQSAHSPQQHRALLGRPVHAQHYRSSHIAQAAAGVAAGCGGSSIAAAAAAAAAASARPHGAAPITSGSRRRCVAAAAAAQPSAQASSSSTDALRTAAIALAKVADDTKASDISLLHVEPIVSWTSYMLLCTVMSKPQLLAVLSRMADAAAEFGLEKQNSAGSSQWEVLDFGSLVVHVFTADEREHYNLDDFYALAAEVELPFIREEAGSSFASYEQQFAGDSAGSSGSSGLWSKSL